MRCDQTNQSAVLTVDAIEREVLAGSPLVKVRFHQPRSRDARRPTAAATARFHGRASSGYSRFNPARPRRRLRREIRWIGWTMLSTMPLLLACVLLRGSAANAVSLQSSDVSPRVDAQAIDSSRTLSNSGPSIVFPGYLLPDDGSSEDQTHAGG